MSDPTALAEALLAAQASGQMVGAPPSAQDPAFDLTAAYAVEAEVTRIRRTAGHKTAGLKVGFANKAAWRVLKLDTLVWAHMYEDTVRHAQDGRASLSLLRMRAPKIEPEIVFKLKRPLGGAPDASAALEAVDWLALGFEIIDCPFPGWAFQPADFAAASGFHAALIVGQPRPVEPDMIPALIDALPRLTVALSKDGEVLEKGSGKNSLRSPALCLAELATAIGRRIGAEPLAAGDLVSTGTLTESRSIAPGEIWTAVIDGLDVRELTVQVQA